MTKKLQDTAYNFWSAQKTYPQYAANIKLRRLHELNYLVPKLQETQTLTDLGCGSGDLVRCLRELTPVTHYNCMDFSPDLLKYLENFSDVTTYLCDFSQQADLANPDDEYIKISPQNTSRSPPQPNLLKVGRNFLINQLRNI